MKSAPPKLSLSVILATGAVAGAVYFLLNVALFFPSEQLALMRSGFLRLNLFVYSFCIWTVGFTLLSALLFLVTAPLGGTAPRTVRSFLRWFLVLAALGLVLTTGYAVWHGYANTPPHVPREMKTESIRASALLGGAVAVVLAAVLALLVSRASLRRTGWARALGPMFLICLTYVLVVNLPIDYARHGRRSSPPTPPSRVVVFGVDAGSWNVLLPLVEAGDLPTFAKVMGEGTSGYLATYGRQYTPPSWTTIATGKEEEDHGVHSFNNVSTDWKAAPLWSILSGAGRRTGVVNWVCAWPPFEVDGGFVSKIMGPQADSAYFSPDVDSLQSVADAILYEQDFEVAKDSQSKLAQVEQEMSLLRRLDEEVMSPLSPDFLAYYYYGTDTMQHFFWDDMAPETFAGADWSKEPTGEYPDAVRAAWRLADGFLSHLMENYGDDACYVVISDHGGRAIEQRKVDIDLDALLEELGYLARASDDVDYAKSTCFVAKGATPHFVFDLKVGPAGYTSGDAVDLERYRELEGRIVDDLRSVRLRRSGRPLFTRITGREEPGEGDEAEIRLHAASVLMNMPDEDDVIVAAEREIPVDRVLRYHPWSGRHRPRGIVLARGPAIEARYSGAWTIDEPYTVVFRFARGIIKGLDRFSGVLRRLHLIDEMTTLDVAPTILHVSGLPVALDMDGRVAIESLRGELADAEGIETIATYGAGATLDVATDPEEEERMRERLRALGYVQ